MTVISFISYFEDDIFWEYAAFKRFKATTVQLSAYYLTFDKSRMQWKNRLAYYHTLRLGGFKSTIAYSRAALILWIWIAIC